MFGNSFLNLYLKIKQILKRRTGQIKLKPLPFKHYQEFFPGKSHQELIEYYAITGGVPKYIELFYDSPDIYTAIEKNVLSKSSFLYDEPNFLLQQEVPTTEDNPQKSKRGLYKIKDNFMRFWFQFTFPNLSYIESGNEELAMEKIRQNLADNHISYIYEDICREEMWQYNAEDNPRQEKMYCFFYSRPFNFFIKHLLVYTHYLCVI